MTANKRLLVVGGTGRDVGKTEFICRLIERTARVNPIYALKVSVVYPDEELFHGSHRVGDVKGHLFEEQIASKSKDTSRMLLAGAKKAFYLRSGDDGILDGYNAFQNQIPDESVVICESNSLGQVIEPALSIVIRLSNNKIKSRAYALLESADLVVVSDGVSGFSELDAVEYLEGIGWRLKKIQGITGGIKQQRS